jgi:hypothetical protein
MGLHGSDQVGEGGIEFRRIPVPSAWAGPSSRAMRAGPTGLALDVATGEHQQVEDEELNRTSRVAVVLEDLKGRAALFVEKCLAKNL